MTSNDAGEMANGTFEVSITAFNNAASSGQFALRTEYTHGIPLFQQNMLQVNVTLRQGNNNNIVIAH